MEHLLQSESWAEFKSRFGWTAGSIAVKDAAARLLFRHLPLGQTLAYIPKGPQLDWQNVTTARLFFAAAHAEAQRRRAIFLKVEPDVWSVDGTLAGDAPAAQPADDIRQAAGSFLIGAGFIPADTIQPRTSVVIDISHPEVAILAAMKQKTRYNIRLAEKRGVTVRQGSSADVAVFYELSLSTAARDEFPVHSLAYYQSAFELFGPERCALLLAEYKDQPLAAVMVFCHGETAYYFYGASANEHRELMPAYLAQWAAIRWARSRGCRRYDLWGVPDADAATLEAEFQHRHDGLWGVYRFKRGFGGYLVRSIGAYDYVYNRPLYQLYKLRRRFQG